MGEVFTSASSRCFGMWLHLEIKVTPLIFFLMITNCFINLALFLFYIDVNHLLMGGMFY